MQEREQHEEDHGGILQGQFVLIFLDLMEMIHLDGYIKPINFSIFIELNILKCCYLLPFTLRARPSYGNKIWKARVSCLLGRFLHKHCWTCLGHLLMMA
jgi:hypothetical protein